LVYLGHRDLVLLKQVKSKLLGVAKIMYDLLAINERIHTIGDETFTSSHLIAKILCKVLILILVKSAGIFKKALKARVNSLCRNSRFKFLALYGERRVRHRISKLDCFWNR